MSRNTINPKMLLPRCLLLLWMLTAFVSSQAAKKGPDIKVTTESDGIKVSCPADYHLYRGDKKLTTQKIDKKDENTGEYICKSKDDDIGTTIFVKFRSCDNCVDLNTAAISGMIIGDLVATFVIAVAVYLVASQGTRTSSVVPNKKSSDRQHLMSSESSSRSVNDHYQKLRPKKGQRDTYDVLNKR